MINKFQFCHYPKSGGRTIELILAKRFGSRYFRLHGNFVTDVASVFGKDNRFKQELKAHYFYASNNECCVGGHIPPQRLLRNKATFIRDPVSRMYSEYNFFQEKNPNRIKNISFIEYVEKSKNNLISYESFYLGNDFFFLGIFEHFEDEARRFANLLNVDMVIPKVNSTHYSTLDRSDQLEAQRLLKSDCEVYDLIRELENKGVGK